MSDHISHYESRIKVISKLAVMHYDDEVSDQNFMLGVHGVLSSVYDCQTGKIELPEWIKEIIK